MVLEMPAPKLTFLIAPAGYGKSTLLDEWHAELTNKGRNAVLVRLAGNPDSEGHLAFRISQSIAQSSSLLLPDDVTGKCWRTILDTSITEFARSGAPIWILLDCDGDGPGEATLMSVLAFLLDRSPDHLHVIFAGRRRPAIRSSRLRISNQIVVLESQDLSFDADEIGRLFREEKQGEIDPFDVNRLMALTQGWPAGIRFAALQMHKTRWHKDALAAFTSLPQDVTTFFDECVAADLSATDLTCLSRIVALNEIDLTSCSAILGENEAARIMDRLADGDLFATRADSADERYRFHPLFRQYLQNRLEAMPIDEVADLHRKISLYCASKSNWAGAVHHAFACGDKQRAIDLAERCAADEVSNGNLSTVLHWISQIPKEELARRRLLLAASGTGYALCLRLDEARAVSVALASVLDTAPDAPEAEALALQHRVLQICIAYMSDDGPALLALAQEAMPPGSDKWLDVVVSNALIHGNLIAGCIAKARGASLPRVEGPRNEGALFAAVCQKCLLGLCDIAENRFDKAKAHFSAALELAESNSGPDSVPAALAASLLAMVAFEQGDLLGAEHLLAGRLDVMEATAFVEGQIAYHLTLARLNYVKRNWNAANLVLDRGIDLARRRGWLRLHAACLLEKVRVALWHGQTSTARALSAALRALSASTGTTARTPTAYAGQLAALADGWLLLASGKPAAAMARLDRLDASCLWDEHLALQVRVVHAAALYAAGRRGPAIEAMITMIELAAFGGLHRCLIDSISQTGAVVWAAIGVLSESDEERVDPAFLQALSEAVRTTFTEREMSAEMHGLTPRESDLVRLIRHGMTNKEIAHELDIGLETVKWHLKGVFRKLGARNRTEVLSRMSQLRAEDWPLL